MISDENKKCESCVCEEEFISILLQITTHIFLSVLIVKSDLMIPFVLDSHRFLSVVFRILPRDLVILYRKYSRTEIQSK